TALVPQAGARLRGAAPYPRRPWRDGSRRLAGGPGVEAARLHGGGGLRLAGEPGAAAGPGGTPGPAAPGGSRGPGPDWWGDAEGRGWGEAEIGDASICRRLVLGHEAAGVIESGPRRGTRVAIDPAVACGTCRPCRAGYRNLCARIRFAGHGDQDGALREFLAWPSDLLHPLPDSV